MTLRYLSLFDGIGAAHVAAQGLGWQCVGLAEIEPAPAAVTASHWPNVPNFGDVTAPDFIARVCALGRIDLIVGGPPCQDFSVAGLRAGLDGDRGNLTLRYLEIIYAIRPVLGSFTENVPGWLNVGKGKHKGRAFGSFLGSLVGEDTAIPAPRGGWTNAGVVAGPGGCVAWRTLDAQGFVPQRRCRVFVLHSWDADRLDPVRVLFEAKAEAIRHLGDRAHTGPLFPERQGVRGHPATGRGQGAGTACNAAVGVALRGREGGGTAEITRSVMPALRTGGGGGDKPHVLAFGGNNTGGAIEVATAVNAHSGPCERMDFESETFVASVTGDITHALNTANNGKGCSEDGTGRGVPTIAYPIQEVGKRTGSSTTDVRAGIGIGGDADPMFTLQAGAQHGVAHVRRLLPIECLRLQGFPDDHLDAARLRNKPLADGPRYKAIGNSWAVPCVRWIFQRINAQLAHKRMQPQNALLQNNLC